MRNTEYQFVSTDTEKLATHLIAGYETITGHTLHPASADRLFIQWVADIIVQERVLSNYTGNQNIPSRATGQNLDALGELFYDKLRPEAQPAKCTMRFWISAEQSSAVLIPAGTRATDVGNSTVWETTTDVYIDVGKLYVDIMVQCQTYGVVGNGFAPGQINTLIDIYNYATICENTTKSDGGADVASDNEYFELMRASEDAYSDAGAKGGYIYFAKSVSTKIVDVVANSPAAGKVAIYVLMDNGTGAASEIKSAVLAACNADYVRPLTDSVTVEDPEVTTYDITLTYYIPSKSTRSSAEIQTAVQTAVDEYVNWQHGKLGRDINPSTLIGQLMSTGIKRVVLTSPTFTPLRDGSDNSFPQLAKVGTVSITNGGHEDE